MNKDLKLNTRFIKLQKKKWC